MSNPLDDFVALSKKEADQNIIGHKKQGWVAKRRKKAHFVRDNRVVYRWFGVGLKLPYLRAWWMTDSLCGVDVSDYYQAPSDFPRCGSCEKYLKNLKNG